MKTFYEYRINGIYGSVIFSSDRILDISNKYEEFTNTLVNSFERDYWDERDSYVFDDSYGCKNNITNISNQRGLPEGITMDMYFNMVIARKDFNYGEIQSLKTQLSNFETKQQRMKDEFASDLYYIKNKQK